MTGAPPEASPPFLAASQLARSAETLGHARPHPPAETHLCRNALLRRSRALSHCADYRCLDSAGDAATRSRSTAIDGPTMSGCLIWSRDKPGALHPWLLIRLGLGALMTGDNAGRRRAKRVKVTHESDLPPTESRRFVSGNSSFAS
jgi:hypothetical protein